MTPALDPSPQPKLEGFSFDSDGYLLHLEDWTPELATMIAEEEKLTLTALHWEVIHYVRQFYLLHQDIPKMRTLIAHLHQQPAYAGIKSSTLHQLFPLSPALQIARIAGLPKPKKCL